MNEYGVLFILEAAAVRGTGSMKKMQDLLINTVDQKKEDMFEKAKTEVLKKFNHFKVYLISNSL